MNIWESVSTQFGSIQPDGQKYVKPYQVYIYVSNTPLVTISVDISHDYIWKCKNQYAGKTICFQFFGGNQPGTNITEHRVNIFNSLLP